MSDIQTALAALGQMATISNGLRGAQTVLDTLANAEQVEKELSAAVATKRAELAEVESDLADKTQAAEAARLDAQDTHAKAQQHFEQATHAAGAAVAEIREKAEAEIAQAREHLTGLHGEIAAVKSEIETHSGLLARIKEDFAAARMAAKVLLADHTGA